MKYPLMTQIRQETIERARGRLPIAMVTLSLKDWKSLLNELDEQERFAPMDDWYPGGCNDLPDGLFSWSDS